MIGYSDACQMHGFGCGRCGKTFDLEMLSLDHANVCESCGFEIDAAIAAERATDFQALSKEWFQRVDFRTPLHELVDRDTAVYLSRADVDLAADVKRSA